MPTYEITTTVCYTFEIEADDYESAQAEGWNYEDYKQSAIVDSIDVTELESDDDE